MEFRLCVELGGEVFTLTSELLEDMMDDGYTLEELTSTVSVEDLGVICRELLHDVKVYIKEKEAEAA
tara:strand:+ start:3419 stop:3619 length:201 start_codon:yes stop_codon:yes gene_type:complete